MTCKVCEDQQDALKCSISLHMQNFEIKNPIDIAQQVSRKIFEKILNSTKAGQSIFLQAFSSMKLLSISLCATFAVNSCQFTLTTQLQKQIQEYKQKHSRTQILTSVRNIGNYETKHDQVCVDFLTLYVAKQMFLTCCSAKAHHWQQSFLPRRLLTKPADIAFLAIYDSKVEH